MRCNGRMRHPPPIRVDLSPSRVRRIFIAAAAIATSVLAALLPLGLALRVWIVVLIAALAARLWRDRLPAAMIVRLDGSLALLEPDGSSIEATLLNGGYLGYPFTSIVCRPLGSRRTRTVAILPDMLSADDYRRLRVRLRYARSDDDAGDPASHARASTSTPLSDLR